MKTFPLKSIKFIFGLAVAVTYWLYLIISAQVLPEHHIMLFLFVLILLSMTDSAIAELNTIYEKYKITNIHFTLLILLLIDFLMAEDISFIHYSLYGVYLMILFHHKKPSLLFKPKA